MTTKRPTAVMTTQLHGFSSVVLVQSLRRVTYRFKTSDVLRIPYALAIDGVAQPAFKSKPARVEGKGGEISVMVQEGQKVHLFLNSDAHPDYRRQPVYALVAGEHHMRVFIEEKKGKHADSDTPVLKSRGSRTAPDEYAAP